MTKARENSDYTGLQGDLALKSPVASPSFTGKVGIGSSSPVRQLEIKDDGTLGQAIVGIIADAGDAAGIFMGTTSNNNAGGVRYFTDTNKLTLRANDEDRLLIDSAGRVTTPNQPSFRVSNGGAADYTTIGYMTFGTATLNTGTHYSTSTGKFTAPIAGIYYFAFRALTRAVVQTNMWIGINVNGIALTQTYHTHSNHSNISAESIVSLSANDYVQVVLGGGGIHSGSGHDKYTFFQGHLIG